MPEIERKFLVARLPEELGEGVELCQAYLAVDGDVEVRIRSEDGECTLTVKGGGGLERTEVEFHINPHRFAALWPLAGDRTVEKVRHRVPVCDQVAEVDVYRDRLAGLEVVEVEFASRADAEAFVPPDWFGTELTGEPGWSNAALARDGVPGTR